MIKSKKLSKIKNLRHGFFNSVGGKSKNIYSSLNCGLGSKDNPTNIKKNLQIVKKKIGSSEKRIFLVHQIHSNKFVFINKKNKFKYKPKADAIITNKKKIPIADKNKATVRVRIRLIEKDERVLPDMGVRVSFLQKIAETSGPKKEGVIVPNAAVYKDDNSSFVLLVKNGRILIQEIEVAEETSNYSRVIKGIRAGDQVVASYDEDLENNQKVTIN